MSEFNHSVARIAVGAYDDAQETRISMMNRVRDIIRKKNEDIPFDEVEDEKEDQSYDDKYQDDNLPELLDDMLAEGKLEDYEHDYLARMLDAGQKAEEIEEQYKSVMEIAGDEPIYTEWLEHVNGVSFTLTARLLHRLGYCEKFDRVSQLWSYCGLAPGQERKKGEQLGYDPQAKKLAWLVADCMMKQGSRSTYRTEFFDPYKDKQVRRKERAEDMTDAQLDDVKWTPPESQGHAHNRAMRYLAKKFLKHFWYIARDIKGLETPDEWVVTHGGHEKRTDTFENPAYAKRQLAAEA